MAPRRYPKFTDAENAYLALLWNTASSSAEAQRLFYEIYPHQKGHNLPVQVSALRKQGIEIARFPRDRAARFRGYHDQS